MQDTETPTTKPQNRGKSSNSILSSDICLLYVVLRMQTCCSGVCRTYTPPDLGALPRGHQIKSRESEHASNLGPLGQSSVHVKNRCLHRYHVCMRAYTSEQNCLRPHKTIRGKFRSCGFGSNFCPVEVAQWPKASAQRGSGEGNDS